MGKLPASHRYDRLPLLRSRPGGIRQELVVQDLPGANITLPGDLANPLARCFITIFGT